MSKLGYVMMGKKVREKDLEVFCCWLIDGGMGPKPNKTSDI